MSSTDPASSIGLSVVPPPSSGAAASYRFRFHGDGTGFFVLLLKNVLLTLLTLGIYAPWAKTHRRKYIWSNVELGGQRFLYSGTGIELFKGYLKAAGVYLLVFVAPAVARAVSPKAQVATQALVFLAVFPLVPFAIYWSRRYLLTRTSWRGVRFGLDGQARVYAKAFVLNALLTAVTLGLWGPIMQNRLRRIVLDNTRFGTAAFSYDGKDKEVWILSMKGFVLSVLTLGVYWFWMQAKLHRYQMEHTSVQGVRFRSQLTGGRVLKLFLLHMVGTTLSLGLAFPWIVTHSLRSVLETITIEGELDFARVSQRASAGNPAAEGMADMMGVDLGL